MNLGKNRSTVDIPQQPFASSFFNYLFSGIQKGVYDLSSQDEAILKMDKLWYEVEIRIADARVSSALSCSFLHFHSNNLTLIRLRGTFSVDFTNLFEPRVVQKRPLVEIRMRFGTSLLVCAHLMHALLLL